MVMAEIEGLWCRQKILHHLLIAGRVVHHHTAFADALIRLNMRAGRHLLQLELNRFAALRAFEVKKTCGFHTHVYLVEFKLRIIGASDATMK